MNAGKYAADYWAKQRGLTLKDIEGEAVSLVSLIEEGERTFEGDPDKPPTKYVKVRCLRMDGSEAKEELLTIQGAGVVPVVSAFFSDPSVRDESLDVVFTKRIPYAGAKMQAWCMDDWPAMQIDTSGELIRTGSKNGK